MLDLFQFETVRRNCAPERLTVTSIRVLLCAVAIVSFSARPAYAPGANGVWVGSWATSQQIPEPHNALPADDLRDATLRQIVRLSVGGATVRVHVSNAFGTAPLRFASVHIAKPLSPGSPLVYTETDRALTFSGKPDVVVPAGAEYVSDPVAFPVKPLSDIAISIHFDDPPAQQTGHPGSRTTSFLVHGDQTSAADLKNAKKVEHWYQLAGIDVLVPPPAASIVVLGDSITDGHGSTTNGNDRWTDFLARRLQNTAGMHSIGVLNHGIGGNNLLKDGLGPNALARFDRDVLAQTGVKHLIVLEGINDLGNLARTENATPADHAALVQRIIAAYQQIVLRARTHGIQAIGCTLLPYVGSDFYHPGPESEADRQAVNAWIRTPGNFDAVIDLDQVIRDPEHPDRMLPLYDSGDHLHPSPAGFAAMAGAVPLSFFAPKPAPPQIAITFDDVPAHGPLPPGQTRFEVATKIVSALRNAGVPPVYGFVNGADLHQNPGDAAALQKWIEAGNPIGNHTWSHMNLNERSVDEYTREIERDEPILDQWMPGKDWRWFRYPFLAEGETPEKKQAVRMLLRHKGYKIAGVTMGFNDYKWNEPYARCVAKGDEAAIAELEKSFLAAAEQSVDYYRDLSRRVLGRDIPYVLLMHLGAFDAHMMPQLLELYRSKGFQFITLEQAESDPFYRTMTDPSLPPGPNSLEGAASERNVPLLPHTPFAPPPNLCK